MAITNNISFGTSATSDGTNGVAFGAGSQSNGINALAFGASSRADGQRVIRLAADQPAMELMLRFWLRLDGNRSSGVESR